MSIIVSSTTDDQAAVKAAAGIAAPAVEETPTKQDISGRPPKAPEPKPVETPEEEEPAEEGEEEEDDKPQEEAEAKPKRLGGFQRKIQSLERDKEYAFRRMIALEDQLRRQQPPQQQPQQPQRPAGPPQQSDFQD